MAGTTANDSQAQQVAGQAQEKASELAGQAKDQAQQAAGQARQQVRTQVDQRSTQAGEQVSQQAGDIRSISQQLREQGKDKPAQYVDQAADKAEQLGDYLKNSDADRILHDVEDFARQRPWAVVAGGIALGLAASRFLKASSNDRYYGRQQPTGGYQGYTSPPPTGSLTTGGPSTYGDGLGRPGGPVGTPADADRIRREDSIGTAGGVVDPATSSIGGPPIPPPPTTSGGL